MSHILITGGCGFVGSHTCISLIEKGYSLVILDNEINSTSKSLIRIQNFLNAKVSNIEKKITFINTDLKNFNNLLSVFSNLQKNHMKIDFVIHLAGLKDMNKSLFNPLEYWENNVKGSINLLKVMEIFNCRNIVFSSSASIYDARKDNLFNEKSPIYPLNPYGKTKLAIENILYDIYKNSSYPWRIVNLRFFNPAGAHPSGEIGEHPFDKSSNLFPLITKAAIGKTDILNIFGNDWPTPDGTAIRDYVHIMDLSNAHFLAMEYLKKTKRKYISINIGSGVGTSILKLVRTFESINQCKVPIKFRERREGDSAVLLSDISLARKLLNWSPKKNLIDICRDGWLWQKKNPNGYE